MEHHGDIYTIVDLIVIIVIDLIDNLFWLDFGLYKNSNIIECSTTFGSVMLEGILDR